MNRYILTAAAVALTITAAPAQACRGIQSERTIYPIAAEKPDDVPTGMTIYRVRYDGARAGREDRLWPNFYVVQILDGDLAGTQALMPAHITSCHSVAMTKGEEGYVTGNLSYESERFETDLPILNSGFTGKTVSNWPVAPVQSSKD